MTVIYILWTSTSEIPLRVLELENLYRWGLPVEIVLSGITAEPVTEDKTHAPLLPGFPREILLLKTSCTAKKTAIEKES